MVGTYKRVADANIDDNGALGSRPTAHLPGMHDERDVAMARGGERAKGGDDGVLPVEAVAVALLADAQHELHVVHDHVRDIVHITRVLHCLSTILHLECVGNGTRTLRFARAKISH